MGKLLKLFLTLSVGKRFVRNTVATLLVQLQLVADHHIGSAHVLLAALVGALTAAFKALRDTFPNAKWMEYLPL